MAKTREALIDAGLRLAERTGLAGLSVNLIVQEARRGERHVLFTISADRAPRISLRCTENSMKRLTTPNSNSHRTACRPGVVA